MSIWDVLGIEETKDKEQLKRAYRCKLKEVNPEDDSEGFMRLRQAYEEAISLSNISEDHSENLDESKLQKDIKSLYNNYSRRIDVSEWEKLLDQDEFVTLDSSDEAFDTLIRFLMDKFFLPQNVWKLIVDKFDIASRIKELSERYPENFIEYMINNSLYDDILDFDLLECKDELADKFLDRYFSLDLNIRKHDYKVQKELIELISDMDAYHPYFELLKIKSKIQEYENLDIKEAPEKLDQLRELYTDLYQDAILLQSDYPDDINFLGLCGDLKILLEDYQEAGEYYKKALEIKPNNYIIKGKMAEQKFYIGEYDKSRDLFMELLRINHYDNSARSGMIRANTELIKQLEESSLANPNDKKIYMEISWSLYQIYKFSQAIETLDKFQPDEEQVCEYNNLKGRVYLCLHEIEKALECFEIWKAAIEAIPSSDESKESRDKKKRYGYVNFLIGDCYLKMGEYDKARHYFDIAMSREHDEIILSYEAMCELEYETEKYEECIEACEKLIAREKRSFVAYNYLSKACLKLDYIKEAMDASNRAIEIYPYIAEPYETQIKVMLKFKQIDGAKSVLERYNSTGITSDKIKLCESRIHMFDEKYEEALKVLDDIIENFDSKASDISDSTTILDEKAYCLEMLKRDDEALEIYEKIVQIKSDHPNAYGRMGIILKNNGKYSRAIEMFDKQIEVSPDVISYVNRGTLNRFFQKYKSALADFEEALKIDPENSFCYSRIGLIYETHREFEKAIENYDKALMYAFEEGSKRQLYTYKARTLQCMLRFDECKRMYDKYIQDFGMNPDIAYDISELAVRMDNVDYATRILEDCINRYDYDENVKHCVIQLISIYGMEGYVSRANETFLYAVNKFGQKAEFFATMGEALKNNGLCDQAVKHYAYAVKLDIDNKHNYYSDLIELLKRRNPFRQDLKKYVQKALINPVEMTTPMAYIKMARLNRAMKKYKEALAIIDKGLNIKRCSGCFYGGCHDGLYEKGLIYEAMKDYDNALMCYRKALALCGHNALYEECIKRIEGK